MSRARAETVEFPDDGEIKVSCPAATGPDALRVGPDGIEAGTCSDGEDNDCDGNVDYDDPDCDAVQDCSQDSDLEEVCVGNDGDLSSDNIKDGMYCDTDPSTNRCCQTGTDWDSEGNTCSGASQGCQPDPCDFVPFSDGWWDDLKNCIDPSTEACVQDGYKHGEAYYDYKSVSSY